jgi:hypothetical protein
MADNARENQLATLFDKSVQDLIARVESGEATAGDYKNIIQLFKDNGITCEIKKGSPFARLAEVLPFTVEG